MFVLSVESGDVHCCCCGLLAPHQCSAFVFVVGSERAVRSSSNQHLPILFHEELYDQGRPCFGWAQWKDLLHRRQLAWDEAEDVSLESGFPFKDRDGNWHNEERRDLSHLALKRWCSLRGMPYE